MHGSEICCLLERKDIKMKSLGIVRHIDDLGRVVIPVETRRNMDINPKDPLEMFVDGDQIILQKYEPYCIFCGDSKDVIYFKDKKICSKCLEELKEKA